MATIDIYSASREWKKDGNWVMAPAGLYWIKEGEGARIGEGASLTAPALTETG